MLKKVQIFKWEQALLEWIHNHLDCIAFLAITVLGALIRYSLRTFVSGDMKICLLPWFEQIRNMNFVTSLQSQVGNYNLLYQLIISVITRIPFVPMYLYKMLSCGFDYLLAFLIMRFVYLLQTEKTIEQKAAAKRTAIFTYAAVLLSPLVFLNSAAWGQCDSIFVFFAILSLYLLFQKKYLFSFLMLGISFAFKLQMVFILPFFVYVYLAKKEFSCIFFLLIPVTHCVTALPNLLAGRQVLDLLKIYWKQTNTYSHMYMNYPSFWCLFGDYYATLKWCAIFVTLAILGILVYWLLSKRPTLTKDRLLFFAFLLTFTCVLFLPAMHERYSYLYEVLAILLAFRYRRTIPLTLGLIMLSMKTYSYYLFQIELNIRSLSITNCMIYVLYLFMFYRMIKGADNCNNHMREDKKENEYFARI